MDTPIDDLLSQLQEVATRLQQMQAKPKEPKSSFRDTTDDETVTLAVESLHTAHHALRQQQEQLIEAHQVAAVERKRYYTLFDGTPDASLVTDVYGKIQEANHAATHLLNTASASLRGKSLALYVVTTERRGFRAFLLDLQENTSSLSRDREFTLKSRDLSIPLAVSATVVPMHDAWEQVMGFRWVLRDIRQQRHTQAQLLNTNQLLLSLIDASPLGIVAVDREVRVQLWNHAAETLLGWHRAEVMAETMPYPLPAEVDAAWDAQIQQGLEIEHHEMETEYRHKDGILIPVRLVSAPLEDSSGKRTGIITLIEDLRGEVQHRAEIRAIKSRLTATRDSERRRIAQDLHDDVIQQLVGLQFELVHLRNLTLTPTDPHLEAVQLGLSRMGSDLGAIVRLVRTVLSNLRPPGLEAFGLKRALETYITQAQHTWQAPAPQIDLQLPDADLPLPITVSTVLLRVTQEALRNVRHHAEAHRVGIWLVYTTVEVSLQVQDNGKGFDCPSRLSDLAQTGHFGLLGVAEQVESVGGVLQLASQPGQGTTMKVTIPLAENRSAAEAVT